MIDNVVYLNSSFVKAKDAKISVFDRAFLYGDGVYEAFRIYKGKFTFLSEHMDRLLQSANEMDINLSLEKNTVKKIINKLLNLNQIDDAYIRINISRGLGDIGVQNWSVSEPCIFITAIPFSPMPTIYYEKGIEIGISSVLRNASKAINPQIKGISNLNSLLAKIEARKRKFTELIMLNQQGFVCEGAASNVFWIKDKILYTPCLENGILGGVTRSHVIHLAKKSKLTVIEGFYKIESLLQADEVFLTSTSYEILPIIRIEEKKIGNNKVGFWSKKLLKNFRKLVTNAAI